MGSAQQRLVEDGWTRDILRLQWERGLHDNRINDERIEDGWYNSQLPTNRRRKRERCKAKRRARMAAERTKGESDG